MRLIDDYDEDLNKGMPMIYMATIGSLFVIALLCFVLYINRDEFTTPSHNVDSLGQEDVQISMDIEDSFITAQDLNIWEEDDFTADPVEVEDELLLEQDIESTNEPVEEQEVLNPYITTNQYDDANLVYKTPQMQYFHDGEKISTWGIDLDENHGIIDFNKVNKAGIQFVMLRLGSRGYESGKLVLDTYFKDYLKGATDAGIEVGIYFESYALTDEEIKEEVSYIVEQIGDYQVNYPVVISMKEVDLDNARTDGLQRMERTELIKCFVEEVELAGYVPMIYGTEEFLKGTIELSQLAGVDVWLSQIGDLPDYPYEFHIWQYDQSAIINGIEGTTNLNMSYIDYTKK